MFDYVVTTKIEDLETIEKIVMVDGTVPGWSPSESDYHYDHHRPGGAPIQLAEIPDNLRVPPLSTFVTTQVDADACAAAAWIQLLRLDLDPAVLYEAQVNLLAIAYDCDHLGLPEGSEWDPYRDFAANAVATMKISGDEIIAAFGLPSDRKTWTADQKKLYASEAFKRSTEWLVDAALGKRKWPGESGEASAYWDRVDSLRPYVDLCSSLIFECAVLDQRSLSKYCDPRLLVEWARKNAKGNVTLTIRDRTLDLGDRHLVPAYAYTLGSVPLHKDGSPLFSDRGVWARLAQAEREKRQEYGYPEPTSDWGGRNEVGGSSWNDASILAPIEVIEIAIGLRGY